MILHNTVHWTLSPLPALHNNARENSPENHRIFWGNMTILDTMPGKEEEATAPVSFPVHPNILHLIIPRLIPYPDMALKNPILNVFPSWKGQTAS